MNDSMTPLFGPGSQPESEDGEKLDYMEMPRDMVTFERPIAPEPEDTEGMEQGKAMLNDVLSALKAEDAHYNGQSFELNNLPLSDLGLINQILGEGEVSIVSGERFQAQESVLAGVWRVLETGQTVKGTIDRIEIGAYPLRIKEATFQQASDHIELDERFPDGVLNAPSIVAEIKDKVESYQPGDPTHAINLTLLPQTEEDIEYLAQKLGVGHTIILSRGYGNCRVSSTMTKNVWWVQYFNSQDATILNSIEIVDLPDVVQAAPEDIEDSEERLREIMEIYK